MARKLYKKKATAKRAAKRSGGHVGKVKKGYHVYRAKKSRRRRRR